ncbi:tetratricopeptide repeat protein [Streptomyces sviceus]|uniref:tetratricopeptide repeat protein n=1 Tax=Streptomyces sviceus TaxID=285530 RepID=UPI00368A5A1C
MTPARSDPRQRRSPSARYPHDVFRAERCETAEAEHLFEEARAAHRGVSPFPLAQLDFRRGVMWLREGDLPTARSWFDAARRRVPGYAPATGHLAEVDLLLGAPETAVARLRPLMETGDDPEYPAHLALALRAVGRHQEARPWRDRAAERYEDLVARHPKAYADHAADFWLMVGGDVDRGLQLALQALVMRQTGRSYALVRRAREASGNPPTTPPDRDTQRPACEATCLTRRVPHAGGASRSRPGA